MSESSPNEVIDGIVDWLAVCVLHGELPVCDAAIIAGAVIAYLPCWRDASQPVTQAFVDLLIPKLRERIDPQRAHEQQAEFPN